MIQTVRSDNASGVYCRTLARVSAGARPPAHGARSGPDLSRCIESVPFCRALLASSLQAAAGSPEVRESLVAKLHAVIHKGGYAVEAREIAVRLLSAAGSPVVASDADTPVGREP